MRRRGVVTAVQMLALTGITAFAGHALAGMAPASRPPAPVRAAPTAPIAVQPVFGAPGAAPRHIIWLYVNGRWHDTPA